MENNKVSTKEGGKEEEQKWRDRFKDLLTTLPTDKNWNGTFLYLYQGFWFPGIAIKGCLYFQKYFKPQPTDIILASSPKSGTIWLKALVFTIVHRSKFPLKDHPLLTTSTHELVPFFEFGLCKKDQFPNLDRFPQPRVLATHVSYASLPCSVKDSDNKIVYLCRNPFDLFISQWHFTGNVPGADKNMLMSMEETFDRFCQGINSFGPFWDQMLGYYKVSQERPDKVLFLKYEDLKKDSVSYTKKLASFLGYPFSEEEETQGLIQEISGFCSFESMKDFEVNKNGVDAGGIANTAFFRNGKVGDSLNYLSPEMVEKMEKLIQEKLGESGLSFSLH